MPKEAKVFVIEDNESWLKLLPRLLAQSGHHVVGTATTLAEALKAIPTFADLEVQVVTLDGNLTEFDTSGVDAIKILEAIRAGEQPVKVIGLSGNEIQGVNINLGKSNATKIGPTITKLF